MNRRLVTLGAAVLGIGAVTGIGAQQRPAPQPRSAEALARPQRVTYASKGAIEVVPVQGGVYMLAGAGSNITVQVGADALFVVDSNVVAMSDTVLAAIRTISPHFTVSRACQSASSSGEPGNGTASVVRNSRR